MKIVIAYLLVVLVGIVTVWVLYARGLTPHWVNDIGLLFHCVLAGGLGGIVYCLRAIYLNACVRKAWDKDWLPWYYIRPLVSLMTGGVSWLFLRAGLLVLDATQSTGSSNTGFIGLAFIAGYNVDKFLAKVEQISEATWGIEKSRTGKLGESSRENDR